MADTFNYAKSLATANRLITKFGATCAVRRTTSSGDPWAPTQTTTDYVTIAAVVDYTEQQRAGGDILVTDKRAIVAAGPLTALGIMSVLPSDSLVIGGVAAAVVRAVPLNPAGTTIMYDCQVRF